MIKLELPWPPSVNHYWRMGHNRIYLGAEGKRYKAIVNGLVRTARVSPLTGHLGVQMIAHPPDRRRRDLDNLQKCLWDSIGAAGLYEDDSQIKHIAAWMLDPVPGGKVIVCLAGYDPDEMDPPPGVLVPQT